MSINNNEIAASDLVISGAKFLPKTAVCKGIRPSYVLDDNGKKTAQIEAVRYDLVNPTNFDTFTIKVPNAQPVMSPETFKALEDVLYLDIPTSEALIKPYAIEYGKAKLSIVAPSVTVHKA